MVNETWEKIEIDGNWIFIQINNTFIFTAWIRRLAKNDNELAEICEKKINEKFQKLGLQYDIEKYGKIKMKNIRLQVGSDGICIPEICFINPSENILRIENPFSSLSSSKKVVKC
jgi:hypothetical protein